MKALVLALALALQGCAAYNTQQRPWDPKQGRTLYEQIPAWDGAANRLCGGHMDPEQARREGRTLRC
jgi:hypothetical protein